MCKRNCYNENERSEKRDKHLRHQKTRYIVLGEGGGRLIARYDSACFA